ncbi:hypothetical protein L6452_36105 [Arctium lappa]|uniref:Uncharacterized protein n=1 Tax=Arctium lappa TaxID=4217 RepID=A0ACB8Y886_ARCLA|nr:hypothetical protein L6452_36105 [Arctium lappa]
MRLRRKSLLPKSAEEPSDVPALLIECQHVAVLSLARLTKKIERAFLACATKAFGGLISAYHGGVFDWGEVVTSLDPLYDVLVEPLGYDALLLEYHGIEYPDLPEAPEKAISAFRTVKGNSYVPHRSESPPPHNTY